MEIVEIFEPGEVFLFQFTNSLGELINTKSLYFDFWTQNFGTWDITNLVGTRLKTWGSTGTQYTFSKDQKNTADAKVIGVQVLQN